MALKQTRYAIVQREPNGRTFLTRDGHGWGAPLTSSDDSNALSFIKKYDEQLQDKELVVGDDNQIYVKE